MSCERLTSTTSPAAKGELGVSVTVLSPLENAIAPLFVPETRPKTRRLSAVIELVCRARSKVMETDVAGLAATLRSGLVDTTCNSAARAPTDPQTTATTAAPIAVRSIAPPLLRCGQTLGVPLGVPHPTGRAQENLVNPGQV